MDFSEFTEEDDFLVINDYKMTEDDLKELDKFLTEDDEFKELDKFLTEDVYKRQESLTLPEPNCNLDNPDNKLVHYSSIIRFCNVVKEILSDFETLEFENVRHKINVLKKQNNYSNRITRDRILDLLVHWDYKILLAYITQKEVDNSGINYKKIFKGHMSNIYRNSSSVFNRKFDKKLTYGEITINEIKSIGFTCIEAINVL